jgi:ATP-dependent Clp protease ATP-binding subunit ClpA
MISQELETSLHMTFVEARQQRHEFVTVECLLLALLDNPSAQEALLACNARIEDLRKLLADFIKGTATILPGLESIKSQPTLGFQRVIQRAIMHVQSTGDGKKEVAGVNVLVALYGEKDSHAVHYLHQQGVTRLDVVNFIANGLKKQKEVTETVGATVKEVSAKEVEVVSQSGPKKPKTFPEAFIKAGGTSEMLHLLMNNPTAMGQVVAYLKTLDLKPLV